YLLRVQEIVRIPITVKHRGVDSKDALTTMKKVNVGELTLRGVCVSKD
ncbi:hypothetical protein GQN10_26165, partial [Escherichia coli]|nr:hypothetical protein [Escherichia coli]